MTYSDRIESHSDYDEEFDTLPTEHYNELCMALGMSNDGRNMLELEDEDDDDGSMPPPYNFEVQPTIRDCDILGAMLIRVFPGRLYASMDVKRNETSKSWTCVLKIQKYEDHAVLIERIASSYQRSVAINQVCRTVLCEIASWCQK